jgi:Holliday junction resolvase RusA-like endonuclease
MITWMLHALGTPAPKGSWDLVPCGRPVVAHGDRHYRIRDIRLRPHEPESVARWKHALELAILEAGRPRAPHEGPITIEVEFYVHRPKKPKCETAPITAPDLDKLTRQVGDVLEGVYYRDDSQIVAWIVSKHFAEVEHPEGATIIIRADEPEKKELTLELDES